MNSSENEQVADVDSSDAESKLLNEEHLGKPGDQKRHQVTFCDIACGITVAFSLFAVIYLVNDYAIQGNYFVVVDVANEIRSELDLSLLSTTITLDSLFYAPIASVGVISCLLWLFSAASCFQFGFKSKRCFTSGARIITCLLVVFIVMIVNLLWVDWATYTIFTSDYSGDNFSLGYLLICSPYFCFCIAAGLLFILYQFFVGLCEGKRFSEAIREAFKSSNNY